MPDSYRAFFFALNWTISIYDKAFIIF